MSRVARVRVILLFTWKCQYTLALILMCIFDSFLAYDLQMASLPCNSDGVSPGFVQRQQSVLDVESPTCVSFRLDNAWPQNCKVYFKILLNHGVDPHAVKQVDIDKLTLANGEHANYFVVAMAKLDSMKGLFGSGLVVLDRRVTLEIDSRPVHELLVTNCPLKIREIDISEILSSHGRVIGLPSRISHQMSGYVMPSRRFKAVIVLNETSSLNLEESIIVPYGRHCLVIEKSCNEAEH